MAFALTMTAKQIARGIASFKTMSKKQDDFLHVLLMQSLAHGALPINDDDGKRIGGGHGDLTLFAALLEAAGERAKGRKAAIVAWATNFCAINVDGDGKVKHIPSTSKRFKAWDLEGANDEPYWMFEPDPVINIFDIEKALKMIEAIGKRIDKAAETNSLDGNVVDFKAFAESVTNHARVQAAKVKAAKIIAEQEPKPQEVVAAG